ncbi:MAG: DUF2442 domain-containing protein [Bacteriovoracaceae bacterium]|nr:DUF2442 domain-containing protein [Bacteriovoracaceae bacterium]
MEIIISKAEYIAPYKIKINFKDGTKQIVDFDPFLSKSKNPEIKKYLDVDLFKTFKIIDGDLNWNDFDLIFPIYDLYTNQICKHSNSNAA